MGRLQYINRKIEGVKLGQVVAKDLRKRIPPSLGSKAAFRDPQVELDITNKGINDEAAEEICSALVASIRCEAGTTNLEELKLRENSLTAKSLRSLAKVVRAAANELRDLDLGYNAITITTDDDADAWEEFLLAFSRCVGIRRLDLSGNHLGLRAFEKMQKIYLREDLLGNCLDVATDLGSVSSGSVEDFAIAVGEANLEEGEDSGSEPSTQHEPRQRKPSSDTPERTGAVSPRTMARYSSTSGLRSIPYICLFRTQLDSHCALYLSYIVEQHSLVAELLPKVPPAKSGMPTTQIESYDLIEGCNGILWKPNDELVKDGIKVLELAEQARINICEDTGKQPEEALSVSPMVMPRKASDTPSPFTPIAHRNRRGSTSSGQGSPFPSTPGVLKMNTLDAVRNRMQAEIVKDHGLRSNGLWHAAIRMLALARPVLATDDAQLPLEDDSPADNATDDSPASRTTELTVPETPTPLRKIPESRPESPTSAESLWPRVASTKVEDTPPHKQTVVFRLNTNRHGQSTNLKLQVPNGKNDESVNHTSASSKGCGSSHPMPTPKLPKKQYRSNLPKGLSERVWGQIIAYAVDAGDSLSSSQQAQVINYASDRLSLRDEYMRLGKQEHAQVWKILEQMGCLTYA